MKSLNGLLLALLAVACTRVDVTEHCVLTRYGTVIEERMESGLAWTPIADATCFPLTEQNYPPGKDPEVISAQTEDPVTVQGDMAIVFSYDPATVYEVFTEKRSQAAAEIEIINAIREGYRNAISSWTVAELFSDRRPELADSVKAHIQRKIGSRAQIRQVFVREISVPPQIEGARVAAAQQAQRLDQARKQYTIDSVNARATILQAQATAEKARLEAVAYSSNQQLLGLRIAEAYAAGLANACKGAATCVIGGSVMDIFRR